MLGAEVDRAALITGPEAEYHLEAAHLEAVEHEPELRAQLRLSLEPEGGEPRELPFRAGRAIGWLEDALAPLRGRMREEELRRLVLATGCAVGIEALAWLTDIAGLSREEAVEVMGWSARALFQAAMCQRDSSL